MSSILENDGLVGLQNDGLVGLENDGLVVEINEYYNDHDLENNGLVDEKNEYYDDHDGLILAIDEDNYNHDGIVNLNNDNDGLVDLDNDNDCLVDPDNNNDCLVGLNRDGLVSFICLVGDDGDSTSHSVCCLIDDLDGDSVSGSVGSLGRCIHTINTSLSSWSQESRNFMSEFAKNIKEQDTIYWVQGLCANREKSLALGERVLKGLDRANCPSANFNDRVLEPVAARLRAKMVYCNIRDVCIRGGGNCMCATSEEAERMSEVISVIAELAHRKKAKFIFQNCSGKSIKNTLIPKIKKVISSARTITFVNEDSYYLSFYDYQCNRCFFTRELQEYRIYLDLQNMYEDLRVMIRCRLHLMNC